MTACLYGLRAVTSARCLRIRLCLRAHLRAARGCVCAPVFISHTVQLDTRGNVRDLRSGAMGAGKGGELDY